MTGRRARSGGRWVQGAVAAAVSAVHHTRPGPGASAAEHAVWWQRHSDALHLVADHERDPVRAAAVRADAATAATLAAGMGAAHTTSLGQPAAVPGPADRWSVLDDAAVAATQATATATDGVTAVRADTVQAPAVGMTDLADVPGLTDVADVCEADLLEMGL